jgi:hypothetical protein
MRNESYSRLAGTVASATLLMLGGATSTAGTPCGGFEECRVLVEINASDGDVGFHWVSDGEDLVTTRIDDPSGTKIFENRAFKELWQQYFTETRGESAEPKCRKSLAEPDEDVLTVRQFVQRFPAGTYTITGITDEGEVHTGKTPLTYYLPAAPKNVSYSGGVITWQPGTSLGVCATEAELWQMVNDHVLPVHPMNVRVKEWEVTFEINDRSHREFTLRIPAEGPHAQTSVTVSPEFLNSVGPDTPAKLEVGAVGGKLSAGDDDNATFTELRGICLHKVNGCKAGPD